jgi:hypothetical protein
MAKKPTNAFVSVPDPASSPSTTYVEQGGFLQWSNNSHAYPYFDIEFAGPNPYDSTSDEIKHGGNFHPVTISATNLGNYTYNIRHKKTQNDTSGTVTGPSTFSVVPCDGCY